MPVCWIAVNTFCELMGAEIACDEPSVVEYVTRFMRVPGAHHVRFRLVSQSHRRVRALARAPEQAPEQAPGLYGEIAKRVESGHGEPPEYAWTDPDLGLWSFGSHGYPCELGSTVSTGECDAWTKLCIQHQKAHRKRTTDNLHLEVALLSSTLESRTKTAFSSVRKRLAISARPTTSLHEVALLESRHQDSRRPWWNAAAEATPRQKGSDAEGLEPRPRQEADHHWFAHCAHGVQRSNNASISQAS